MSVAAGTTDAAEFVDFFQDGWKAGATDPERFFAHFGGRLTPDCLLTQPLAPRRMVPTACGRSSPLFEAVPDLRVEVVRWGATDDGVLIEIRLHGTLGGRPLEWTAVDRLVLRDGLITERHSYFDPLRWWRSCSGGRARARSCCGPVAEGGADEQGRRRAGADPALGSRRELDLPRERSAPSRRARARRSCSCTACW